MKIVLCAISKKVLLDTWDIVLMLLMTFRAIA